MQSQIYFTGRLTSHCSIKSTCLSFLIICRDLCRHLTIPLKGIIQPMLRLLNTTTLGSPVLHRLRIRYVKLTIVQFFYDCTLFPTSKPHSFTLSLPVWHSSHPLTSALRALVVTRALSYTRVQVIRDAEVVEVQVICFCGLKHFAYKPLSLGRRADLVYSMTPDRPSGACCALDHIWPRFGKN